MKMELYLYHGQDDEMFALWDSLDRSVRRVVCLNLAMVALHYGQIREDLRSAGMKRAKASESAKAGQQRRLALHLTSGEYPELENAWLELPNGARSRMMAMWILTGYHLVIERHGGLNDVNLSFAGQDRAEALIARLGIERSNTPRAHPAPAATPREQGGEASDAPATDSDATPAERVATDDPPAPAAGTGEPPDDGVTEDELPEQTRDVMAGLLGSLPPANG